ncbi:MAG: glycosyltransferase family 2 protein [Flavobacteriaceae bacterium]|nr:glycosyltransferase family 2 protein [Flavobacteriaceae bacterium]
MIDVSCILINYNNAAYTIDAVKSIAEYQQDALTYEIVIVDNASKENDLFELKNAFKDHKNVLLVESKINLGFGAGNMLGVQYASNCKYYAFINNDTLQVTENFLTKLKDFMDSHHDAAICSPQMLDENKNFRETIDHFSSLQREILRRPLLEKLFPKIYLNRKVRYSKPTRVHYVQGSFMFTKAEDLHAIGGFDTNFFLYYEESDISRRLLKSYKKHTYLVPSVEYLHYKSATIDRNILIKIEQKISLFYYIEKHYGWWHKKVLNAYYILRYFFTSLIKPRYWKFFYMLLKGMPLSASLKQKQIIITR